jgi:hypothetical protein
LGDSVAQYEKRNSPLEWRAMIVERKETGNAQRYAFVIEDPATYVI